MVYKACDWANTKEIIFVDENLQLSKLESGDVVLVETGAGKQLMKEFEDNGGVKIVMGNYIAKYRKELDEEKTDEGDAKLIMQYFQENPKKFKDWNSENAETMELFNNLNIYEKVTKIIAMIKNNLKAQEREYGNKKGEELLKTLEKIKIELLKPTDVWVKPFLSKVDDIPGLGKRILAGILLNKHPKGFKDKSDYINYCGFTSHSKETKRYNRKIKSLYYMTVEGIIKQKTKNPCKYSEMYYNIKEKLKIEHPEKIKDENGKIRWNNGHINSIAINRVSTLLAKEVWKRFHSC